MPPAQVSGILNSKGIKARNYINISKNFAGRYELTRSLKISNMYDAVVNIFAIYPYIYICSLRMKKMFFREKQ